MRSKLLNLTVPLAILFSVPFFLSLDRPVPKIQAEYNCSDPPSVPQSCSADKDYEIKPACTLAETSEGPVLICYGNNYRLCGTGGQFPAPALGSRNGAGWIAPDQFSGGKATYNSVTYDVPTGGVYWCDSNVFGCVNPACRGEAGDSSSSIKAQTRTGVCEYKIETNDLYACPDTSFNVKGDVLLAQGEKIKVTWGGTLDVAKDFPVPFAGVIADFLEGPYYNEPELEWIKKNKTGYMENDLHGPVDKLTPPQLKDTLKREFIRRIKSGELSDYRVEGKTLSSVPDPPVEGSSQQEKQSWQIQNFTEEQWKKVPMFARDDAKGFLSISVDNAANPVPPKHFEVSMPHLTRLYEISSHLWRLFTPAKKQENPEFASQASCPGGREGTGVDPTCNRLKSPKLPEFSAVDVLDNLPGPQSDPPTGEPGETISQGACISCNSRRYTATKTITEIVNGKPVKKVVTRNIDHEDASCSILCTKPVSRTAPFSLEVPFVTSIKDYLAGPKGIFTYIWSGEFVGNPIPWRPRDLEAATVDGGFLFEDSFALNTLKGNFNRNIGDIDIKFPYLGGIKTGLEEIQKIFRRRPSSPSTVVSGTSGTAGSGTEGSGKPPGHESPLPFTVEEPADPVVISDSEEKLLPPSSRSGQFIIPTMIIVHWSAGWNGVEGTYNALSFHGYSCQFAVDEDKVWQMMGMYNEYVEMSWCAYGYNEYSINIEMSGCFPDPTGEDKEGVCGKEARFPPNSEINRTLDLICALKQQYNIPSSQIFGHYEKDDRGQKSDPGKPMMSLLRELIKVKCP